MGTYWFFRIPRYSKKYIRRKERRRKAAEERVQAALNKVLQEEVKKRLAAEKELKEKSRIKFSPKLYIPSPLSTKDPEQTVPKSAVPPAESKSSRINTSPRARYTQYKDSKLDQQIQEQGTQLDLVQAFELQLDRQSFIKALMRLASVSAAAQLLHDLVARHKREQREQMQARSELVNALLVDPRTQALVLLQRHYRAWCLTRRLNSATDVMKDFLSLLKGSIYVGIAKLRSVVIKCQRCMRNYISCTAARLFALNCKWSQLVETAPGGSKLKRFTPLQTRYYLLYEWLQAARKELVRAKEAHRHVFNGGGAVFGPVNIKQVQRFLKTGPVNYNKLDISVSSVMSPGNVNNAYPLFGRWRLFHSWFRVLTQADGL